MRAGGLLPLFFGGIALFYGVQGLLSGATFQQMAVQFIIGIVMIVSGLYATFKKSNVPQRKYTSKECFKGDHMHCTDAECGCGCHRGAY